MKLLMKTAELIRHVCIGHLSVNNSTLHSKFAQRNSIVWYGINQQGPNMGREKSYNHKVITE